MKVLIVIALLSFGYAFGQEVKLGLPVGHTSAIISVQSNNVGNLYLTCGWEDNSAKIWNQGGTLIHTLRGHSDLMTDSKFSPDNKLIATSSEDHSACIWDVQTGRLLKTLLGHKESVNSLDFSPDNASIVTGSNDKSAIIWDVATGTQKMVLSGHTEPITIVRYSTDGNTIITVSINGTVKFWDGESGKELYQFENGTSHFDVRTNNDGNIFASITHDNIIRLWDVKSGAVLNEFKGHLGKITTLEFNESGTTIASTSIDCTTKIWSISSGKLIHSFENPSKHMARPRFSPDGKYLATSKSSDSSVVVYDLLTGKIHAKFSVKNQTSSCDFNGDGSKLMIGLGNGSALIFDLKSTNLITELKGFEIDRNSKVNLSNSDFSYFYSTNVANVFSMNSSSGIPYDVLSWNREDSIDISYFELSNDAKLVAIASSDNSINLFNPSTKDGFQFDRSDPIIFELFSNDNTILLDVTSVHNFSFTNTTNGKDLGGFNWPFSFWEAKFTPNAEYISFASDDGIIRLVNRNDNSNSIELNHNSRDLITSFDFSPNGRNLVSSIGNYIYVWDIFESKIVGSFIAHDEGINSVRYSYDGALIMSTSMDNTCKIWRFGQAKPILILEGHKDDVISVNSNHDGSILATFSYDGSTIFWDTKTGKQISTFLMLDSDPSNWVHLHPSGLFDASPEAMELMYWTKGLEVIEFAQLKDRYWLPGLWEKVMKGEPLPDVRNMSELKLQPEVSFGELKNGQLPIVLTKRDGGYGKVSIFINGKEVLADARGDQIDSTKQEQTLNYDLKDHPYLTNGVNKIEVKASSADGFVQGKASLFEFTNETKEQEKPQLFAITIGVSQYSNIRINLNYPEKDAKAMAKAIELGANALFGNDKTHLYSITSNGSTRPNKENIREIFREIAGQAKANDVIMIYLSGHGITYGGDEGDFYFLTADATAANKEAFNDPAIRMNTAISTSEFVDWLKEIAALKQVMVIDACGSGKAVDNLLASRDIDASKIKAIDKMKDRTGMYIISGSAADAASFEANRYGQGLLTYSLLQGMKGAALDQEKFYDVQKLFNYALETVPELAEGVGGIQRPQILIPKGGSFAVGMVDELTRQQIPLNSVKPIFVRSNFVDAKTFQDPLKLSKLIDDELLSVASKGDAQDYVFIDAREFPDAYSLTGGYNTAGGNIELILNVNGPTSSQHKLQATNVDELKLKILDLIRQLQLK